MKHIHKNEQFTFWKSEDANLMKSSFCVGLEWKKLFTKFKIVRGFYLLSSKYSSAVSLAANLTTHSYIFRKLVQEYTPLNLSKQ